MEIKKIRNAVGAIITQNNEILLIHKVKLMDVLGEPQAIQGTWDFPKGGVLSLDTTLEEALMRELKEETGSTQYKIEKRFAETINFSFLKGHKYEAQETVMYHVVYTGDRSDIKIQDDEIDDIMFVKYDNVLDIITLDETKEFFNSVKRELE